MPITEKNVDIAMVVLTPESEGQRDINVTASTLTNDVSRAIYTDLSIFSESLKLSYSLQHLKRESVD